MKKHWSAIVVSAALLAACSSDDNSSDATQAPTSGPSTSSPSTAASTAPPSVPPAPTSGGATVPAPSTATTQPAAADTAPDDLDPDGVVHLYYDLSTNGGPEFDISKLRIGTEQYPQDLIYGSLFSVNADKSFAPGLATSAQVVDPATVQIKLRDGVVFSDGTPFDADAVKAGIERNRDVKNPVLAAELQQITSITADDPLQVTLHLATPIAGTVYDLLPTTTFAIVSPTAVQNGVDLSTAPVGAGPFLLDGYQPGQLLEYVRNPKYYAADQVRLAGIEIQHVDVGAAQVTAIRSGAVDVSGEQFSYAQSKELAGTNWKVESYLSGNVQTYGQMCKSRPPFDDVRVRQAINYAIDRDAINAAVVDGKGAPMYGLFPTGDPLFSAEVDQAYAFNPQKARDLLAEANQSNLQFDTFFVQSQRVTEIIQAELKDVGVTMNIKPFTAGGSEWYPAGATAEMNLLRLARSGIAKVSRTLMPPSVGNVCNYDDPDLIALVQLIQSKPASDPAAKDAWMKLQKLISDKALNFSVLFEPEAIAYNPDRIGDPTFELNLRGERIMNFEKIYIKKT